jgi:hypothetical protein
MRNVFTFVIHIVTGRFRSAFELVRHLRLGTQLTFVGLAVGSYTVHQYPHELYTLGEWGYYAGKLATTADAGIPLSEVGRHRLAESIATLQGEQTVELMRRDLGVRQGYNTWSVAQMVVALADALPVPGGAIQRYFEANIDEECACWRETPEKQPHTGATAWTVFSMSKIGILAPPRITEFLLTMQSPEGWWPLYPAKLEPRSASSYATAWATLALCSQLPLQQGASAAAGRINSAITRSFDWLSENEIAQSARWLDYPANTPALKSVSISGLIVHAKSVCGGKQLRDLYRHWLKDLPSDITDANSTEVSNTYLTLSSGALDFDRTRHYSLQWSLIATVDAYEAGTLPQRAAALQWIERILTPGLVSPEVRNQNWVAAELLYALKHLREHVAAPPRAASRRLEGSPRRDG